MVVYNALLAEITPLKKYLSVMITPQCLNYTPLGHTFRRNWWMSTSSIIRILNYFTYLSFYWTTCTVNRFWLTVVQFGLSYGLCVCVCQSVCNVG